MLLLILACFAADPTSIPPLFTAYFERQDEAHAERLQKLEQAITDAEIAIKGEPLARRKAAMTGLLHKQQDELSKLKKSKERPTLPMPPFHVAKQGNIGQITEPLKVHAIIDADTMVLSDGGLRAVIVRTPTKKFKARMPFENKELWEVVSTLEVDSSIERYVPSRQFLYTVKEVDTKLLTKARATWDAEKAIK